MHWHVVVQVQSYHQMLTEFVGAFRSLWPVKAALSCIRKALENLEQVARPKVVVVSDTPSFISTVKPSLEELAEVFN